MRFSSTGVMKMKEGKMFAKVRTFIGRHRLYRVMFE